MSEIKIEGGNGCAHVSVDGVMLNRLTSVSIGIRPGEPAQVTATMAVRQQDVDLSGAALRIAGCEMPEAVETALLEYLCAKHPMRTALARATGGLFDVAKAAQSAG